MPSATPPANPHAMPPAPDRQGLASARAPTLPARETTTPKARVPMNAGATTLRVLAELRQRLAGEDFRPGDRLDQGRWQGNWPPAPRRCARRCMC
jgi:hypothetical protein